MKNNKLIIGGVVLVVVTAVSFCGGMLYGQNKKTNRGNFPNMTNMVNGQKTGSGMVSGEITAKDAQSFTVKLGNGGSKIVFFSESTKVSKSTDGALSDLETGEKVMVIGTANEDGSVTAKTIQLGTTMPAGGQPPVNGSNSSGQPAGPDSNPPAQPQ